MERPWRVFVRDVGPSFTFAYEDRARTRAQRLVSEDGYAEVLVWRSPRWNDAGTEAWRRRTVYRYDREPQVELFTDGRWVPQ